MSPAIRLGVAALLAVSIAAVAMTMSAAAGSVRAPTRDWVAQGRIVLSSDRDGDQDLYTVAASGGRLKTLTLNYDYDALAASGRVVARQWRGSVYVLRRSGWLRVSRGRLIGVYAGGRRIAAERSGSLVVMTADGRQRWRLREQGEPSIAPDARHVAFVRQGDRLTRYVVVAVESGKRRRVTIRGWSNPEWAPDGRRLLLKSSKETLLLDVQNAAGAPRKLGSDLAFWGWSPDGRWIVLSKSTEGTLLVVDARTGAGWPHGLEEYPSGLTWSRDSSRLAYTVARGTDTFVVLADVRARTVHVVRPGGRVETVAWSPNGEHVMYLLAEPDYWDGPDATGPAVGVVRRDGTDSRVLVSSDRVRFLAWSRDSTGVLFTIRGTLGVVDVEGRIRGTSSMSFDAAPDERGRPVRVVWSPSGDAAAFTAGYGGRSVYVVRADGTGLRRLTRRGHDEIMAWLPKGAAWAGRASMEPPASERAKAHALDARGPVVDIAAENGRVAVLVAPSDYDCTHAVLWRPGQGLVRIGTPAPCEDEHEPEPLSVAFREGIVAWRSYLCGSTSCDVVGGSAPAVATDDVGGRYCEDCFDEPPVPPASRPATHGGVSQTVENGVVRLERLSDGRTRTIGVPGARIFAAELQPEGLFYAYNQRGGGFHGRVAFVPFAKLFEGRP